MPSLAERVLAFCLNKKTKSLDLQQIKAFCFKAESEGFEPPDP